MFFHQIPACNERSSIRSPLYQMNPSTCYSGTPVYALLVPQLRARLIIPPEKNMSFSATLQKQKNDP